MKDSYLIVDNKFIRSPKSVRPTLALLIWTKSFGKCFMQNKIMLEDSNDSEKLYKKLYKR